MSQVIEISGPQGQTLQVDVYPLNSAVPVLAGVATSEFIPTRYRAELGITNTGTYQVLLKSLDGMVVTSGQVRLKGGGSPQYVEDLPFAVISRIDAATPEAPVVMIPAPEDSTQTAAWTYCYDENGNARPGVSIEIRAHGPERALYGAFANTVAHTVSDANGVATIMIPRVAGLAFRARREQGQWVTFNGVNADTLRLPALLG
jgi:hypothetical protein